MPRSLSTGAALVALLASACSLPACSRNRDPAPDAATSAAASSSGGTTTAATVPPSPPEVSVFYWSDLRGRGDRVEAPGGESGSLARRATLIDQARAIAKGVIVVDAGDFLPSAGDEGGPKGPDELGKRINYIASAYKRMGVGLVVPGERELAIGAVRLDALLRSIGVRAVLANFQSDKNLPAFDDVAIVEAGDVPVGFFGIFEPPPEFSTAVASGGLMTTDGAEAARRAVGSLRERGARLVVGLFHVAGGTARVEQIVAQAGPIDVAVLGHRPGEHGPSAPTVSGRTHIVYAGSLGSHIGRIDVRALGATPIIDSQSLPLTSSVVEQLGVGLLSKIEPERVRLAEEKAAMEARRKKGQKEPVVYESWTYGSSSACALCHPGQAEQWKGTPHARAGSTLKEAKHERDLTCLGCHATGYLQPGGTRSIDYATHQFADVGCESCHGPSALHVRSMDKKKGTSRGVAPSVCFGCHTPDQHLGPDPFVYASAIQAIMGPGHGAAPR